MHQLVLDAELIPLTVPEVRRLLYRLMWAALETPDQVLQWSDWCRRHQARAKRCHWRRSLQRAPPEVRL
jgi:hypothetical protein